MNTPFKMKGYSYPGASPLTKSPTNKEKLANLLKAVPDEKAFNKLSEKDQKGFTDTWIKYGGVKK